MEAKPKNELTFVGIISKIHPVVKTKTGAQILRIRLFQPGKEEKYDTYIEIDLWNERIDYADYFDVGSEVRIRGSLAGRIYEKEGQDERVFMSVNCWSIKDASTPEMTKKGRRRLEAEEVEEDLPESGSSEHAEISGEQAPAPKEDDLPF